MSKTKEYNPNWFLEEPPRNSYRSIFKWGNPKYNKVPSKKLYRLLKQELNMSDEDFQSTQYLGLEEVRYDCSIKLSEEQVNFFRSIVGAENVHDDDYTRLQVAYGKTMFDLLRLRQKVIENVPDLVIYPRIKEDIEQIVAYCGKERIPIYVYGGGSSVTRGVECMKGGISLDMRPHFNKVISFNETDQTITVEAGMSGPKLEQTLNDAVRLFHARRAYTCGHFPQSFEYSVVGGWVVTRGAGQNSTYYGKIEDLVLGQTYATPAGIIHTDSFPAKATGPSVDQIMMGSEGAFGVLTHVTLKVFRYLPKNRFRFSFMFKDWKTAQEAAREIMQSECGKPSVFRLSDPEETDVMLKLYGIEETPINRMLKVFGYKAHERCLFLGFTDGERGFSRNVYRHLKKVCRRYKGLYLTGIPVKAWEKGRFTDPYLRDSMQDFGIMMDTLECSVNWSNLNEVYESVRAYCKSRPHTVCMTHISHVYPQGANLYFIFIAKMNDLDSFKKYHAGILDAIQASGAAMSHHHGIGKMFAPWLEGQIGSMQMDLFRALKQHFDPHGIMNPGGTLGLDLKDDEKRFIRPKW